MDATERKLELWRLAGENEPDLFGVAALLSTIPDTVGSVIRFANSSYVGAFYPVSTVLDAVVRIGSRHVGAVALASLNREVADRYEVPALAEDALAAGRAARHIGRLMDFSQNERETLFVAGLFSSAGAAALNGEDAGYLVWRANQWAKGLSEDQILRRELMAYGRDHALAAVNLLDEWNMPTQVIEAVSAHHAPRSRFDLALWAGMTVVSAVSPARCHDVPFSASMLELGLEGHVNAVSTEAVRYADAVLGDPERSPVTEQLSKPVAGAR